MLCLIIN